jgi:phosphatidylserine/phosphatidylglycerophosphate/cardiolipin synthase-like enzyme
MIIIPLNVGANPTEGTREPKIEVYFSPGGGSTNALVKEISRGKKEILVQAYSLTSLPIFKALLDAHQRGLTVKIIIDKSERGEGLSPIVMLANAEDLLIIRSTQLAKKYHEYWETHKTHSEPY